MKIEVIVRYNSDLTITYDNSTIIGDVTIGNELFSPSNTPQFGVIVPYGTIKVFDKDLVIYNKLLDNTLTKDESDEKDYLVNVIVKLDSNPLGTFESTISYSLIEKVITLNLSNSLEHWDNIPYSGFTFFDWRLTRFDKDENGEIIDPDLSDQSVELQERLKDYISAYELFNILVLETKKYEGEDSFEELGDLEEHLSLINVCAPNLQTTSLMDAWNIFCTLTLTCICKNENNKIMLVRIC